jgi:hypothetical protein
MTLTAQQIGDLEKVSEAVTVPQLPARDEVKKGITAPQPITLTAQVGEALTAAPPRDEVKKVSGVEDSKPKPSAHVVGDSEKVSEDSSKLKPPITLTAHVGDSEKDEEVNKVPPLTTQVDDSKSSDKTGIISGVEDSSDGAKKKTAAARPPPPLNLGNIRITSKIMQPSFVTKVSKKKNTDKLEPLKSMPLPVFSGGNRKILSKRTRYQTGSVQKRVEKERTVFRTRYSRGNV